MAEHLPMDLPADHPVDYPADPPDDLPEAARNLLQSIDLQLRYVVVERGLQNDHTFALTQQRHELEEWKRQILADPTSILASNAIKLEATDEEGSVDITGNVQLAPAAKRSKRARTTECSTCFDYFRLTETVRLRCCSVRYCRNCFREWFTAALDTKQLPKCCDVGIEPKDYARHLNADIKKKYKDVTTELDAERRLWCSDPDCKVFIKIEEGTSGFVPCPRCRRKTCASCSLGVTSHKGRNKVCANYVSDDTLNDAIEANNWKRCPRCHVPVEKTTGCRNIRCQCGVLFCFGCGMSKPSEMAPCKCSRPNMEVDEPVEDPTHDDWQAPSIDRNEAPGNNPRRFARPFLGADYFEVVRGNRYQRINPQDEILGMERDGI